MGLKVWDRSKSQIIGSSDNYVALSGITESLSSAIDLQAGSRLNCWHGATIEVEVNFNASPTDDVKVNVYGSLDGSNFDDVPITSIVIDKGTDPSQISFKIEGFPYLKIGAVQTGSTDSHDVRAYYRRYKTL